MVITVRKKDVERELTDRLLQLRFTAIRDGIFLLPFHSEVQGWLSLPLASGGRGAVDVDPMVGVRHEAVERVVPASKPYDATVAKPLQTLVTDEWSPWRFTVDEFEQRADELMDTIERVAVPFMKDLASLEAIEHALETWAFAFQRRERLPALKLARDGYDDARAAVDRERSILADANDQVTFEHYEQFVRQLLAEPAK
jgi:hypothetical protein